MIEVLPNELITEVTSYLPDTEIRLFRATCKRINAILEPIALSQLTLSWTCGEELSPGFTPGPFPYDKFKAYITGSTRAVHFVKRLKIGAICGYLECRHSPLDALLNITDSDFEAEPKGAIVAGLRPPWDVIEKRHTAIYLLLTQLLSCKALDNLQTIAIETDITHCESQIGHDPPDSLERIGNLLSQRSQILQKCHINFHNSYYTALSLQSRHDHFIQLPPSKELYIRGLHRGYDWPEKWIQKLLNSPHLEGIEFDVPCDESRIQCMFPSPTASTSSSDDVTPVHIPQLRRLRLIYTGFVFKHHHFAHLRGLQRLEVHTIVSSQEQRESSAHRRDITSKLWPQLLNQRIFVRHLSVPFDEVEENALDYLREYPERRLKSLTIYSRVMYRSPGVQPRGHKEMPKRFYGEILPLIASGLEELSIDTDVVDDWCLGKLDEAVEGLKKCTRLRSVHVTVDPWWELDRRMEVLRSALGGLGSLMDVSVAEAREPGGERVREIEVQDLR